MQSQKFNKNVNWNVNETIFNLYINDMAAFDQIKLLRFFKKKSNYFVPCQGLV